MTARNTHLVIKIDKKNRLILARISAEINIREEKLARLLLSALCRHYEDHNSVTFPLMLVCESPAVPGLRHKETHKGKVKTYT